MTDFGVSMFPTDYAVQPPELAREVEARGFESLWFPEHTHIPTSRISPWPGGGDLPQEYWHTHDPFVSLMAAAAATETIKVGTGILLVPEHDVLVAAKSAASLDMISGGRLILGIGAGWNAEELENHGWNFKDRWKVTREIVLAWRELWTQDEPGVPRRVHRLRSGLELPETDRRGHSDSARRTVQVVVRPRRRLLRRLDADRPARRHASRHGTTQGRRRPRRARHGHDQLHGLRRRGRIRNRCRI